MSTLSSMVVKLTLDAGEYEKEIERTQRRTSSLVSGLSNVGGAVVMGGFAAAAGGAIVLGNAFVDSVQGAMEAESIQAELAAVLASTGGKAGMTAEEVNALASSFQKMTPFEDDATVKGENMLLTFTNIGKDVFPQATEAMLNLTQKFGSMDGAATMLGKALNDPLTGVTALQRVGVTFSEEQKKQIQGFMAVGDVASAQKVILGELGTEFGGLAAAAGDTTAGKFAIFQNQLGSIADTIGTAALPTMTTLADKMTTWLSDPIVQTGITNLALGVADFGQKVVDSIPLVINWFQQVADWLKTNEGVIVAILAALGATVGVFVYTTVIPAAIAAITAMAPVIAVIALIAGAAYLLYEAWTNNWGGIQETTAAVMAEIQPIFDNVKAWLEVNIPIAIDTLKRFWDTVLLPAIQNCWNWVQQNAFPIIQKLWDWLQTSIPAALQILSDFWTNTLLPAITSVWDWMNTTLLPFFQGLNDFFSAVFQKSLEALGGFWTNVLLPGLTKVYDYLNGNVFPIFKNIGDWLDKTFGPLLSNVGGWLKQYLLDSFERLTQLLQDAGVWLSNLARDIANLKLPDWLTGPTPNVTVPVPDTSGSGSGSSGGSSTNNGGNTYNNYTVNVEGGGDADAAEATSRAYQNAYGYGYGW